MSEFNDFNNQTPPSNGNRPDYTYNWNGSEHNKNSGGGKIWVIVAIILGAVALLAFGVAFARQADEYYGNSSDPASYAVSGEPSMPDKPDGGSRPDFSRDPNVSVPEFGPADDAYLDLSTDLSAIYEECSPSCCTVEVSVNGILYSIGSGFVIDSEGGYIATNHHVIESGDDITVRFYNGDEYEAVVVGSDATTDLAVLHVEAEGLPQVSFGDSTTVKIGEGVVAIGTPFDLSLAGTMTTGIISGIARDIEITNDYGKVIKTMTLLQTDCSINPGNSGGPLIDMAGNVIGITSMKLVDEEFEGIGFAIPISSAVDIFRKLIAGESIGDSDIAVAAPKIGITVYDVEDGLEYFRMKPLCEYPEGVLIADIEFNCSAYAAGMSRYDIITDFDGTAVTDRDSLSNALSGYRAGDTVSVTVFRFNRTLTSGEYVVIEFKLDPAE